MKPYLFLHLLLLVLIVSPILADEPVASESFTPPSSTTITLEHTDVDVQTISIPTLPDDKTGLLITLTPSADKFAPQLAVKRDQGGSNETSSDFSIDNKNGGFIFIPNEKLKDTKEVFVELSCTTTKEETCEAILSIDLAKEFEITAGGESKNYKDELKGISSMIVKMKVPKEKNVNRIVVHADAAHEKKGSIPFLNMTIQNDKIQVSNNEESISRSAWYAGKTAVIYKDAPSFCLDCEYVLNLKFLPESLVRLQADLLPDVLDIKRKSYLDGLQEESYNVYNYTFDDKGKGKQDDVIIDIQSQEGSLSVYIDCSEKPENFKKYTQKYELFDINDRIVLKKEEHMPACIESGYTIVVFGKKPSVYNIKASENKELDLILGEGTPIKGQIFPLDKISYEVSFPLYMIGQLKIQLLIEGEIEFNIEKCLTAADCPSLLSKAATPVATGNKNGAHSTKPISSELKEIEGGYEIVLDALKNKCFPIVVDIPGLTNIKEQRCVYKVTIKSTDVAPLTYSLRAIHTGHQILYVGQPLTGEVAANETLYYQINIPYSQLKSLSFQLSTLSGHAQIFVSKKSTEPKESDQASIVHEGSVIFNAPDEDDEVDEKNKFNFMGLFFISVQGISQSSFTLTATAISPSGKPVDYATELREGVPHKGVVVMKEKELTHFYKFKLDLPETWTGIIKIVSTTLQGNIYLGVNSNDEAPTPGKSNFESASKNGLEIPSTDLNFQRKGYYYIGVFVDLTDPNAENLQDIVYSLTYFLITNTDTTEFNKKPIILTSKASYRDTISASRTLYFRIPILDDDKSLFITKQDDTKDLDLYLSTNPENSTPGPKSHTKTTKKSHNDFIEVTQKELDEIREACSEYECSIYLSASTISGDEVPFTLSLEKHLSSTNKLPVSPKIESIILQEGQERTVQFPEKGKPAYFTFYALTGKDTYIDIFCPNQDIAIYANIEKSISEEKSSTELIFPTVQEHNYTSVEDENQLNTGAAHLVIPKSEFFYSTVVTIMLEFKDAYRPGVVSTNPTSFSIVAASEVRHIHSGIPYYGNIQNNTYHYFMIDVKLDVCTLIVSLESLEDGDSDLLASFGESSRPTVKKHDFYSSSSVRSELLQIDNKYIYPRESMKGQWVFGVYAQTTGRYILTVVYDNKKVIQLYPNVPTEWYGKNGSNFYFTYENNHHKPLNFRIDRQSGQLNVYIKALEAHQEILNNPPTKDDCTWTIETDDSHLVTISTLDDSFCSDCVYIIAVEVIEGSKFSILAYSEGDRPTIKNSFRYAETLAPGEQQTYQITFKNAEEIFLNTHILSGSVNVSVLNNPVASLAHAMWKDELSPKKLSSILRIDKAKYDSSRAKSIANPDDQSSYILSQRDFFYFTFVNPGKEPCEFKFSVYSKNSTVLLPPNQDHEFFFDANEERAFLFYSPHSEGTINLHLKFCIPVDEPSGDLTITDEMQGFGAIITSWSDKTTVGVGKQVKLLSNKVIMTGDRVVFNRKNKEDHFSCAEQRVEFEDQPTEGRFEIVLSNTFEENLFVEMRVDSSQMGLFHVDKDYFDTNKFASGEFKDFEVSIPGPGYWYFNMIACSGNVVVEYSENSEKHEGEGKKEALSSEGPNIEVFVKEKVDKAGKRYIKVADDGVENGNGAVILFSSAYFNDNKLFDFELKGTEGGATNNNIDVTYNYDYSGGDSALEIGFRVPSIQGFAKNDMNIFDLRLCPVGVVDDRDNICAALNQNKKCLSALVSMEIGTTTMISRTFEGVAPGDYHLSVLRSAKHQNSVVRSFVYQNVDISLKKPFLSRIWNFTVSLFIGLVMFFALYFMYSKLKAFKDERDATLRKSPKKKGYGFVGEDEEDNDDNNLRKDN